MFNLTGRASFQAIYRDNEPKATSNFNFFDACVCNSFRNFPNKNVMHCLFTLVIENNLGLAKLALKTHAFSVSVNRMLQQPFNDNKVS